LYLTNPDEKAALLAQAGIDLVVTLRFNPELAALTAREFMLLLKQHLGVVHLQVGSDFALGRGRQGDIPTLRALGEELGYALAVTEPVRAGSEVISSSRIRTALVEGDLGLATQLLGRPYKVSGEVIHGDGRGRDLGIPTANLDVWAEQIIPRSGVYACRAQTQTGSYLALTNIGVRPTFHSEPVAPRVESMLLDFSGDLYGQPIDIYFISRLRDEQRFASVEALINQIQIDIQHARDTLSQS
jgi:riboflavin kinase/FMN adenylyltransferase